LYACLRAAPDFYAFHRAQGDLRYSDRVIYSPAVPVFRDDHGRLLEEPYPVAFLTAAAPNAGAVMRQQRAAATIPDVLASRARRVLDVAAANGHRRLVLGAWGCGVFADVLSAEDRFELVTFAVLDRRPGTPVFTAFASALGPPG
jgi:uncharacterized protein (TIGR02452 family)